VRKREGKEEKETLSLKGRDGGKEIERESEG
jgi:hypothetical protein